MKRKTLFVGSIFLIVLVLLKAYFDFERSSRERIIDSGYFYFESDSCIQRVQLISEYETFMKYCDWYAQHNFSFKDGIKLAGIHSISLCPYEEVNIYSLDTLDNGIVFGKGYQEVAHGQKRMKVHGFVLNIYKHDLPCKDSIKFCSQIFEYKLGEFIWPR